MTITMTHVVNWVIFGMLVGSLGTYLLYDYTRRDADRADRGAGGRRRQPRAFPAVGMFCARAAAWAGSAGSSGPRRRRRSRKRAACRSSWRWSAR